MDLQEEIEELKKEFYTKMWEIGKEFEEKLQELKKDEEYYFIDLDAMITQTSAWLATTYDIIRLEHKVIFKTEAEAEEYLEYLKAKEKAINEFSKEEWEDDNVEKHCIYYDYEFKTFNTNCCHDCRSINEMCFCTSELAKEFIEKYEKFLRRELGV